MSPSLGSRLKGKNGSIGSIIVVYLKGTTELNLFNAHTLANKTKWTRRIWAWWRRWDKDGDDDDARQNNVSKHQQHFSAQQQHKLDVARPSFSLFTTTSSLAFIQKALKRSPNWMGTKQKPNQKRGWRRIEPNGKTEKKLHEQRMTTNWLDGWIVNGIWILGHDGRWRMGGEEKMCCWKNKTKVSSWNQRRVCSLRNKHHHPSKRANTVQFSTISSRFHYEDVDDADHISTISSIICRQTSSDFKSIGCINTQERKFTANRWDWNGPTEKEKPQTFSRFTCKKVHFAVQFFLSLVRLVQRKLLISLVWEWSDSRCACSHIEQANHHRIKFDYH